MDSAGAGGIDPQTTLPYAFTADIQVNGKTISGPVAPGATVSVDFDWALQQNGPAEQCGGTCVQQLIVGFTGQSGGVCLASGTSFASGTASITLTAPATVGPAVIGLHRTLNFSCTTYVPNVGGASYMAVVAVK